MPREKKEKINQERIIFLISAIIIVLLIILFGAKIYLYARALVGNDLIIKIEADKENLFLAHEGSDTIKITSHALTNLFCNTYCSSRFIDLSDGRIIEEDNFNLKLPKTKEFLLNADELGKGQKLYRFDLECNSQKTLLCETNGDTKKRSLLLTLNYKPTEKEISLKSDLENNLKLNLGKLNYYKSYLNEFNNLTQELNKTLEINSIQDKINSTESFILILNKSSEGLLILWDNEDYNNLQDRFILFNESFVNAENEFYELNYSIYSNITVYNSIIDNLTNTRIKLEALQQLNLTASDELIELIKEYNNITKALQEKDTLSNKESLIFNLSIKIQSFSPMLSEKAISLNQTINQINITKLTFSIINFSLFNLEEPLEKCCFYGKCEECCNDKCFDNPEKYPIILIHGHSFNEQVSADLSLDSFEKIQKALENYGYLNAGSLLLSSFNEEEKGALGKINFPITIKASYYFDILANGGKDIVIQTKTDNLDTYTLRLRDIINGVKYKTNRNKVIIIAHSMGGLIARRYLKVFGEEDIGKLILISTPNHGISGSTLNLCPIFGTELECKDMNKDSLFMSKLNTSPIPQIPVYNIIGIGCETNGEKSDGVVTNSSQYLEYARNYYIKGSCKDSEFIYLHDDILNPEKYSETAGLIKSFLKNESVYDNYT